MHENKIYIFQKNPR